MQAVWRDLGIERTALVAHDYGVSVAQELLSRDPGRIESMAWLNGGMFPDLHRPVEFQRRLAELSGDAAETYITESLYRKALLGVFGRPVPDHTLGEMWADFSKSEECGCPALLGYMTERREHAVRWSRAVESYSRPQTFIWGPADPISGSHVLPRIRDKAPLASIVVLDNPPPIGHFPQVEAPKLVGSLLVKHLQDAADATDPPDDDKAAAMFDKLTIDSIAARAVLVPMNPLRNAREVASVLANTGARLLVSARLGSAATR